MDSVAYLPLSLAGALRRDLDVTANNIANADTAGFKRERVSFETYVQQSASVDRDEDVNFVVDRGSFLDTAQGALQHTGAPLDLALEGSGWFAYEGADGARSYGRDGRLSLDGQGNLVTLTGARVLDAGGAPIGLPPGDLGAVSVARDGTITGPDGAVVGQVGVFEIPDLQAYERQGAGMFAAPADRDTAPVLPAADTFIVQGAIEGSNVQPVIEMTRLMDIQRSFERAMKLTTTHDDLRRDSISRLGRATP
ncbi:flagellar basal-body rod protein FlgF [Roseivivax halodurans JCM 10272]|uniref:Flagellar basal-body rod protein FlgF n=1 Tax=Roseivivax halodurans JCM 10272 TaxID=1449350 RepID=X7EK77_9RHOB|nr:flagellar hook basal-body protein [Roseivivax halodurans]ETX16317.1 flagellar basal-body rod protein FlgF [Roseivivax halodurans JCM 10272]